MVKTVNEMPANEKLAKTALGLIVLGGALILMAQAVKMMGTLRWQDLVKGLGAFAVVLSVMVGFLDTADFGNLKNDTSKQLLGMAAALLVMAFAIEKVGRLPLGQAVQGVLAISAILAAMGGFMALTKEASFNASSGLGLIGMAVSMERLAGVVERFGKMDIGVLQQGLASLAGLLFVVVALMSRLDEEALPAGAGLLMFGVAIGIVAMAVEHMGKMDIWDLAKGLGALVIAIAGLVGAMMLMSKFKTAVSPKTAAAMILMAVAIGMLVPPILLLGAAGLVPVAVGVGAIVVALLALAGTAMLVSGAIPPLQALALALLTFAAAAALFGVGVLALGVGLATLAGAGAAGIQVLTSAVLSLISTLPYLATKLAEAFVAFLQVLAENAGPISEGFSAIVGAILQVLIDATPKVAELLIALVTAACQVLADCAPKIVDAGVKLILALLRGIRDNIREITVTTAEIIAEFVRGIGEGIPKIVDAGMKAMIDLCNGMADAIDNNHQNLLAAMSRLGGAVIRALWDAIAGAVKNVGEFLINIGKAIVEGIWNGIKAAVKWFTEMVSNFFKGIVDGVKRILGIRSPSRVFRQIGGYMMEGLSLGVQDGGDNAVRATDGVAQALVDAVEDVFKDLDPEDMDLELRPMVTPVVNLDEARASAESLNRLFGPAAMRLSAGAAQANPVNRQQSREPVVQNVTNTTNVEFTQNNHSPETLDAMTIYRQTRNQLRQLEEARL